jgi:anti-anti-sigma factor
LPDTSYLHTTIDGVAVVRTPAEIDITTADQLRAALLEASAGKHPVIVVDMTGTVFCDSSGLHALVRARNRSAAENRDLRLVVPAGGTVDRILTLTGLATVLPCFPTLAEALAGPPSAWSQRPGPPAPAVRTSARLEAGPVGAAAG